MLPGCGWSCDITQLGPLQMLHDWFLIRWGPGGPGTWSEDQVGLPLLPQVLGLNVCATNLLNLPHFCHQKIHVILFLDFFLITGLIALSKFPTAWKRLVVWFHFSLVSLILRELEAFAFNTLATWDLSAYFYSCLFQVYFILSVLKIS